MSDKKKGLEKEIGELFPGVAKRNCAQHIYCNFKKEHMGQLMRDKFWAIARSTNKQELKKAMSDMKDTSDSAHTWLLEHAGPKKQWVRA
ncbi:hypothetical protein LIER_08203 [Lithospermum erythrorhizon]|uniref:MULE transposase domain-containing protein n=1 Tax=Lithospermum erythrorhizon TaxID=34254 RepID=A0AAV3PCE6_LITER